MPDLEPGPDLATRCACARRTVDAVLGHVLEVRVDNIRVAADIGVFHHEIGRRQLLTIAIAAEMRIARSDSLDATLDYNEFVAFCEKLADSRINLIETFAIRLADMCLAKDGVQSVEIKVTKPGALTNGTPSVRIARSR